MIDYVAVALNYSYLKGLVGGPLLVGGPGARAPCPPPLKSGPE